MKKSEIYWSYPKPVSKLTLGSPILQWTSTSPNLIPKSTWPLSTTPNITTSTAARNKIIIIITRPRKMKMLVIIIMMLKLTLSSRLKLSTSETSDSSWSRQPKKSKYICSRTWELLRMLVWKMWMFTSIEILRVCLRVPPLPQYISRLRRERWQSPSKKVLLCLGRTCGKWKPISWMTSSTQWRPACPNKP